MSAVDKTEFEWIDFAFKGTDTQIGAITEITFPRYGFLKDWLR